MGFSLTIREGQDAGKQFTFDQPEVSMGRTAENDVVLLDPGVSRRHAVLRGEGGRFFLQDMGSANGTQINGNPISEEELQSGDLVALGPVVLAFDVAREDGATRILDTSTLAPPAPRPVARSSPEQLANTRRNTAALPVRRSLVPAGGRAPAAASHPSPGRASARASSPGGSSSPPSGGSSRRRAPALPAAPSLSASERARFLRDNAGKLGRLKLWLLDKPPAVRYAVFGGAGLVVLVMLALGAYALLGGKGPVVVIGDASKRHFQMGGDTSEKVFGLGDHLGVTVQTRDEVHFDFEYSETIPAVYFVRFESLGVERSDEVDITLNGVHVGNVAPGLGDYTKEQRLKLPRKHLKVGIPNELVFDNSFNPPGNEPWAISKVRLEIKPLPGGPPNELMAMAKKNYELAEQRMGMKDVAAQNRYEAWDFLYKAQLFLEGIEPKPELYNLIQQSLRDVDRELDNVCSRIMLTAKKHEELNSLDKALAEYKSGLRWFPGEDHSCRARLLEKIYEYGETPP